MLDLRYIPSLVFLLFNLLICNIPIAIGGTDLPKEKQQTIDSLQRVLANPPHDTTKVKALNNLAWEFKDTNPDTALSFSRQALQLAQNIGWQEGIANAHHSIGGRLKDKGDYASALTHYYKALAIWNRLDDQRAKNTTLANLGNVYLDQGNYSKALESYFKSLKFKRKLNDQRGIAITLGNIGVVYKKKAQYSKALEYYYKALDTSKELGAKRLMSIWLNNIANVYSDQGRYPKALEYYLKALKIRKKLGNKRGIAGTLENLGSIYDEKGDNTKALKYYQKALSISKELGDKSLTAIALSNIGNIYKNQENYVKALEYYNQALRIKKKMKVKSSIAFTLGRIVELYTRVYQQSDSVRKLFLKATFPQLPTEEFQGPSSYRAGRLLLDTAFTIQRKALEINKEIGANKNISINYRNIGYIFQIKKQYRNARQYYHRAYELADSIGSLPEEKKSARRLYQVYKALDRPNQALKWHERYITHKDSLFNKEKQKEIGKLETRYKWQQKQLKDSLQHAKEIRAQKLKHQHEIQQQRYMLYSAGGGLLIVLVFAGILYNRFRVTQRQRDLIQKQKQVVDAKNREITSSINYAKRIQDALLKEEEHVTPDLFPHFVLLKPQATVSGDFHWSVKKGEEWYVAVADCTGHGVPGGFLTMLGSAFLNEITAVSGQVPPAEILNQLRDRFVKELGEHESKKAGEFRMRDGMDISLLRVNLKTNKAQWAGAKNPLYVVREKNKSNLNGQKINKVENEDYKLFDVKADRQSISYVQEPQPFTNHKFQLQKNDALYLFSDGFPDQFGGPRGKKYMYKRFKKLLTDIQEQKFSEQHQYLEETIENWMDQNDEKQIDDICVLGIKIT